MEGMNFWLKLMKDQKTEKISKNEDPDQNGRKVKKHRGGTSDATTSSSLIIPLFTISVGYLESLIFHP